MTYNVTVKFSFFLYSSKNTIRCNLKPYVLLVVKIIIAQLKCNYILWNCEETTSIINFTFIPFYQQNLTRLVVVLFH